MLLPLGIFYYIFCIIAFRRCRSPNICLGFESPFFVDFILDASSRNAVVEDIRKGVTV